MLNKAIDLCIGYVSENLTHKIHNISVDIEQDKSKIYELYIQNEKANSLLSQHFKLSKQWHPTKNLNITPTMVKPGSHKKVWWLCEKGHEWEATIDSRAKRGNGCPFCSGRNASGDNNLQVLNPKRAKEWHPTKNENLSPSDVTVRSNKKVWWKCKKGHEWEAAINNRARGDGCPYCTGKYVSVDNCLYAQYPKLSKQWHPTKNGNHTPNDITPGSGKKAWWLCEKGHEWEATIASRAGGNGCPYCSNKRACSDNSLQTLNSDVAKQWHPAKNGNLTPNDVVIGSGKVAWWMCEQGHEWEAVIKSRKKSSACPYCLGKAALII